MFDRVKFSTKLFMGMIVVVLLTIVTTSGILTTYATDKLLETSATNIKDTHATIFKLLVSNYTKIVEELQKDNKLVVDELMSHGGVRVDQSKISAKTLTTSDFKNTNTVNIPYLSIGDIDIYNDTELVDNLSTTLECSVTIFHLVDNKLIRASTSVVDSEKRRVNRTYI